MYCCNVLQLLLYSFLASDTPIGTWTLNLYLYGLRNLALTFANILDPFFDTMENNQQNDGSLLYPLATACSATSAGLDYFIMLGGTRSVDWSSHRT